VFGYLYAGTYSLWLLLTNNSTVASRLDTFFFLRPGYAGPFLSPEILAYTLFMKIPLLIADAITLLLIMHVVRSFTHDSMKGYVAGLLWATSPLVFLLEMSTTVEIYVALFILLGVFALTQGRGKTSSLWFALGSVLRFAPLLFIWLYFIGFLRSRKFRTFVEFLGVQVLVFGLAVGAVVGLVGLSPLIQLVGARPGILIPEILTSFGPPDPDIGLALVSYVLVAYYVTKPMIWANRNLGSEVVLFFAAYCALTSFSIPFLLWMLPVFTAYSVVTKFGPKRFVFATLSGLAFFFFEAPSHLAQQGRAFLFIPNVNDALANASVTLSEFPYLPHIIPEVFRSIFSGVMLFLILWDFSNSWRRTRAFEATAPTSTS
jgi:hypothetical protein